MALRVKRRALSLHDKMKIIKYFDKKSENYKKTQIAEELDIPMSTLSTILKNRRDTEEKCKNLSSRVLRRKKNKTGKFNELENVLLDWMYSMNSQNIQTSGPMIRKRALEIANDLDISDFTASSGWLDRFKKRHQISLKHTEDVDSDGEDGSISSLDTFQEVIKDYQACDIFNADEFGLFYRLMPNEDFNKGDKKCENGSMASERLTILACVNSNATEKLPLLVVGNIDVLSTNLPCQYEVENNSWMTREIFVNWLRVLDDYFEIQGRLVVLFVDNSLVHPKEIVLNNINLVLLPPDSEYEMPMTQGIVKTIKQNYRTKLIEISQDTDDDLKCLRDNFSVSGALQYICDSWRAVKAGIIQNCFHKSGFGDYYDIDDDDDEYKAEISMKYHDYLYVDYDVTTCRTRDCGDANATDSNDKSGGDVNAHVDSKKVRDAASNQTAAAALTSVANLKQYLSSIHSLEGVSNLIVIENIVLKSIDDSTASS